MQLQPKKLIQADVAMQRKTQIDEGMKLASKIDTLRETLAVEEGNLERFRKETIKRVQAEIDDTIRVKDSLMSEIRVLEKKKEVAQIPLDQAWKLLKDVEQQFLKDKQAWGEKSDSLKQREKEVERAEIEVSTNLDRAKDLTRRASEKLANADETLKEAREGAASIRNKAHATLLAAEAREIEVKIKAEEVENREMTVEAIRVRQTKKDIEQAAHDRTIKDKYETLARTIKRMEYGGRTH